MSFKYSAFLSVLTALTASALPGLKGPRHPYAQPYPTGAIPSGLPVAPSNSSSTSNTSSTILKPAVHWGIDTSDVHHLKPRHGVQYFYSEHSSASTYIDPELTKLLTLRPDASVAPTVAFLDLSFTHASVPLDHSNAIESVKCSGNQVIVTFRDNDAYQYVKTEWSAHPEDFILASYTPGCAGYSAGQNSLSLVKSLSFDDPGMKVTTDIVTMQLKQAITEFTLQWGTYEPPNPLTKRYSDTLSKTSTSTSPPSPPASSPSPHSAPLTPSTKAQTQASTASAAVPTAPSPSPAQSAGRPCTPKSSKPAP